MVDIRSIPGGAPADSWRWYRRGRRSRRKPRRPVSARWQWPRHRQASVGQRLQELEALHESGALSDDEYASKRAQIIADI